MESIHLGQVQSCLFLLLSLFLIHPENLLFSLHQLHLILTPALFFADFWMPKVWNIAARVLDVDNASVVMQHFPVEHLLVEGPDVVHDDLLILDIAGPPLYSALSAVRHIARALRETRSDLRGLS